MAKFDVIRVTSESYQFIWQERREVAQLATLPFFVKVGTFAAITLLGLDYNVLRSGLLQIPSFFMEGFVVALVIRMALFGEKYSHLMKPGATTAGVISNSHKRIIMGSVVIYVLTKLISAMISGILMAAQEMEQAATTVVPQPTPAPGLTAVMILVFMLWSFRFFWLYVPVAMGVTVTQFLTAIRPFWSSAYIFAMWMFCTVPLVVLLLGSAKILMTIFPGGSDSIPYIVLTTPMRAAMELIIASICGLAMAYAIRDILSGKPQKGFFG